jgi:hypothetical protein
VVADATGTFTGSYLASAVLTGLAVVCAKFLPEPHTAE